MSKFDRIIGYDSIKEELMRICDMIHNKEFYKKFGAKFPNGILLCGKPGLGKTLMAKSFIEESGLKTFTVRKTKSDQFSEHITDIFKKAAENAPSIVFLDDMDKFANEDYEHCDADEYVAIQAGIDDVNGKEVFVLATVNDRYKLPESLVRPGRFDRVIKVSSPGVEDGTKIIKHYMADKKISPDVNLDDLSRMICYSSCAELETILNEATILAAYKRKENVEMTDFIKIVMKMEHDSSVCFDMERDENARRIAIHEAGHLVVCDVLHPKSVGFAALKSNGRKIDGGFILRCERIDNEIDHAMIAMGGKTAVELYYGNGAEGCGRDLDRAASMVRGTISEYGKYGIGVVDISGNGFDNSQNFLARNEAVVHAELERLTSKVRKILIDNKGFLDKVAEELLEKGVLLYSDIRRIREELNI